MTMTGLANVHLDHLPLDPEHEPEGIAQLLARMVRGPSFQGELIRNGFADHVLLAVLRRAARRARRGIAALYAWGHTVVAVGKKTL
jgi:hypothetical protein